MKRAYKAFTPKDIIKIMRVTSASWRTFENKQF